jgi:hypothetical protein
MARCRQVKVSWCTVPPVGVGSMVTQLADAGGVDLVFDVIGGDIGEQSAALIRSAARW